MIVLTVLPSEWNDKFISIDASDSNKWTYIWEMKGASRLRIYSNDSQPWGKQFYVAFVQKKSTSSNNINRVDLQCYTKKKNSFNEDNIKIATMTLHQPLGGIPHSQYPTLRFYAIPWEESNFREHVFLAVSEWRDAPL